MTAREYDCFEGECKSLKGLGSIIDDDSDEELNLTKSSDFMKGSGLTKDFDSTKRADSSKRADSTKGSGSIMAFNSDEDFNLTESSDFMKGFDSTKRAESIEVFDSTKGSGSFMDSNSDEDLKFTKSSNFIKGFESTKRSESSKGSNSIMGFNSNKDANSFEGYKDLKGPSSGLKGKQLASAKAQRLREFVERRRALDGVSGLKREHGRLEDDSTATRPTSSKDRSSELKGKQVESERSKRLEEFVARRRGSSGISGPKRKRVRLEDNSTATRPTSNMGSDFNAKRKRVEGNETTTTRQRPTRSTAKNSINYDENPEPTTTKRQRPTRSTANNSINYDEDPEWASVPYFKRPDFVPMVVTGEEKWAEGRVWSETKKKLVMTDFKKMAKY